jgi:hypothetical protein
MSGVTQLKKPCQSGAVRPRTGAATLSRMTQGMGGLSCCIFPVHVVEVTDERRSKPHCRNRNSPRNIESSADAQKMGNRMREMTISE